MTTPIDISPEAVEKLAVGMQYNGREDVHDMLRALRTELTAEASRLDWAMRHISGRVFRDLGVTYSAGPDRDAIDAAMTLESANGR